VGKAKALNAAGETLLATGQPQPGPATATPPRLPSLIPGKRSQGLIITCLIGIVGALGGGSAATKLFHIHSLHRFFNLSTWLTAIAGAAVLLVACHLVSRRAGQQMAHR